MGKVLEVSKTKPTLGDLPKHEVQYARTNRPIQTRRK